MFYIQIRSMNLMKEERDFRVRKNASFEQAYNLIRLSYPASVICGGKIN